MRKKLYKFIKKGSVVAVAIAVATAMMTGVPAINFDGFAVTAEAKMIATIPKLVGIEGTLGVSSNEGYEKIFDGKYSLGDNTKWCIVNFKGAYVIFSAEDAVIVNGYSMVTGEDNASYMGRNPECWTLYGCNDEKADRDSDSWVEIHSVTNDSVLQDENCIQYDFEVTGQEKAYKYFKLEITENEGFDVMQLCEFMLSGMVCEHESSGEGNTILPTCTTEGYTTYLCDDCGSEYKDDIVSAKGHNFVDNVCDVCSSISVGDFVISAIGNDEITQEDYSYENSVLTIKTDKAIAIENMTFENVTSDRIEVADGVSANITLKGVNISTQYGAAFEIANNSRGNVTITLEDGSENILKSSSDYAGLQKNASYISDKEGILTIKGEINGTGKLIAIGGDSSAGIGGGSNNKGTNITISGGCVEATGGYYGAGIGGGTFENGTNITITGGHVVATGGENASAIGGGYNGDGSNITITGGEVNAIGKNSSAGIGGGAYGKGSNITISGGEVTATGGTNGAGIGGGNDRGGYNIVLNGGEVTATGGRNGAGIGGGTLGCGDNITVSGGEVTATGGTSGAGIGGGSCGGGFYITISGGKVMAIGGTYGAGIGGGEDVGASNITISGGEVTAKTSYDAACIGGGRNLISDGYCSSSDIFITGGSVKTIGEMSIGGMPRTEDGTPVYLLELSVDGINNVEINGNTNYLKKHDDENKLYLYLPANTLETPYVIVNGNDTKKYVYNTSEYKWNCIVDMLSADDSIFTYNGEEHTYNLAESDFYTITGNKQTNAGTHIVTVALKENMVWADGTTEDKTFEFVIDKAESSVTADDVTFTYGDVGQINAATDKDGIITYEVTEGTDVISVDADGKITALKAGTATVMVKASETDNYSEAVKSITVTVNRKEIEIPVADDSQFTYNGSEQTYAITESEYYTITGNVQKYVGTYTVTVTLVEDMEWSDGTTDAKTYEFVIEGYGLCVSKDGKWYYYNKTDIDRDYTGMADNKYGTWYVSNGSIDYAYKGMFYDDGAWVYVRNGRIDTAYTGMAENKYGVWYMKDGKLDRTYTGMYLYNGKWIYVKSGKYDTTYTGMAMNSAGWWYIKNGVLDRTYTGMAKNAYGVWYMKDGKLDRTYTGMCLYAGKWIYVNKGKYDTTYTGLAHNSAGWWYMKNGVLDRTYTGFAENSYGTWYVKNGKLDLTFSGKVTVDGNTYTIKNGKLV